MRKKVPLEVHMDTLKKWARNGTPKAQQSLKNVMAERKKYDRVETFDHDPWESEHSTKKPTYTWWGVANRLGRKNEVDLAGAQRGHCVEHVALELRKQGLKTRIRKDLTFDYETDQ